MLLLLINILSMTITVPIKYSKKVCAKDHFCDFFNLEFDRLRAAVFFDGRVARALIEVHINPMISTETIYDSGAQNERIRKKILEIYDKISSKDLGKAVYEVDSSSLLYDDEISQGGIKIENLFNYENLIKSSKILNPSNSQKLSNSQNSSNSQNFFSSQQIITNVPNLKKYTQLPNQGTGRTKRRMTPKEFYDYIKENGIGICFKCLRMINFYGQITNVMNNTRNPSESTRLLFDIGKFEKILDVKALFNQTGQILQINRIVAVPPNANPAINQDTYLIVFLDGKLFALSLDFQTAIPFRDIDQNSYDSSAQTIFNLNAAGTRVNNAFLEARRTIIAREKAKINKIKFKAAKFLQNLDDSDDLEDVDPRISKKIVRSKIVLTKNVCDGSNYCCLFSCNADKMRQITLYEDTALLIIDQFENLGPNDSLDDFYEQYERRDLGIISSTFFIDNDVKEHAEIEKHIFGKNLHIDQKILSIIDLEQMAGNSKTACIRCLKKVSFLRTCIRRCNDSRICSVVRTGKEVANNSIKLISDSDGKGLQMRAFRIDEWSKFSRKFLIPNIVFWFTKLFRSKSKYVDLFILGFCGEELCAISADFQKVCHFNEFTENYTDLRVLPILEFLPKNLQSVFHKITEFTKDPTKYPRFHLNEVLIIDNPAPAQYYFGGLNGFPPHIHHVEHMKLYEEVSSSNESSSHDDYSYDYNSTDHNSTDDYNSSKED